MKTGEDKSKGVFRYFTGPRHDAACETKCERNCVTSDDESENYS